MGSALLSQRPNIYRGSPAEWGFGHLHVADLVCHLSLHERLDLGGGSPAGWGFGGARSDERFSAQIPTCLGQLALLSLLSLIRWASGVGVGIGDPVIHEPGAHLRVNYRS